MYLMGVPVTSIIAISGQRTDKSFRMYIKASGEEHAQIMKRFGILKAKRKRSKNG
jgi:hypothetical protein